MTSRNPVELFALFALLLCVFAGCSSSDRERDRYDYGSAERKRLPELTLLNHDGIMKEVLGEPPMQVATIGILVYDGVSALESIGPMVVFSELMRVKIDYIGLKSGVVHTDVADIVVDKTIHDVDALDVLVIPGGDRAAMSNILHDDALQAWVRRVDAGTQFSVGVGYGSALLGKLDLLRERRVSFDWYEAEKNVASFGARYSPARYTRDGKYWTSVSATASIDVSLAMLQAIAGTPNLQGAMLDLEYDPAPPVSGGSAATTTQDILDAIARGGYQVGGMSLLDLQKVPTPATDANDLPSGKPQGIKRIGILVYEGFFTLDALGPLAVLSQLDGVQVRLIRFGDEELKSGRTRFKVTPTIADVTALDLLLVPGGSDGTWEMTQTPAVLDWIRRIDVNSKVTASVCTGSWILGAAGLLQGRDATTNWYRAEQMMSRYGARFQPRRYVADGKYWTSAGVSAGMDLSFALIGEMRGEAAVRHAMMNLQYHPEPPIDAGSPAKTDDLVLDMMHQMYDYMMLSLIREGQ